MCLIIVKPADCEVPEGLLRTAFARNSHGWGLMRIGRTGPFIRKGVGKFDEFLANYRQFRKHACAIHFRAASLGSVCLDNTHPFEVNPDTYLMHNGHISDIAIIQEDRSDTWHFAQMLSRYHNDELFSGPFLKRLEKVTADQRIVLLNKDKGFVLLNKDEWFEDDKIPGMYFSNIYSFDPTREFLVHNLGEERTRRIEQWREEQRRKKEQSLQQSQDQGDQESAKGGVPYRTQQEYIDTWSELLLQQEKEVIERNLKQDLEDADRLSQDYDKESDLANQDSYPLTDSVESMAASIDIVNMGKDEVRQLAIDDPEVMAIACYRALQLL